MGKITIAKEGVVPEEGVRGVREELWDEFLANYQRKNPVKCAQKLEAGAFKEIPPSFRAVVKELKTLKGNIREIS